MQVKLLRVIQEKSFRPVGATGEISMDVRILSATHKNLARLVESGQFREDLYYRINVIELSVPPLRERGDDVMLLSDRILEKIATDMGIRKPVLSAEAATKLAAYQFPGNIRELENVLERAATLCENDTIAAADIHVKAEVSSTGQPANTDLGDKLQDIERETILKALAETRFNKTAAAKKLGLTLRALRYRIQKLNIE
jgi:two-component system response regulator PilR (NtrC family)